MSKENVRKWVDALRSGEYEQTTGRLRDDAGFCCLGVACDLYGKEKNVAWEEDGVFLGRNDLLPPAVREWLGLDRNNPELAYISPGDDDIVVGTSSYGVYLPASELNDDYGWTFEQIADAIEAVYLG